MTTTPPPEPHLLFPAPLGPDLELEALLAEEEWIEAATQLRPYDEVERLRLASLVARAKAERGVDALGVCSWFAGCTRPATHLHQHPAFPDGVPACDRCPEVGA